MRLRRLTAAVTAVVTLAAPMASLDGCDKQRAKSGESSQSQGKSGGKDDCSKLSDFGKKFCIGSNSGDESSTGVTKKVKNDCSIYSSDWAKEMCESMGGYTGGGAGSDPGDSSREKVNCYSGYTKTQCNNMKLGKAMNRKVFGDRYWPALRQLWQHESDWQVDSTGSSTKLGRAYGIPQSLPGNKMAAAGSDWRTNPVTQIKWGLGYIKKRYGNPDNAWHDWQARDPHWY